MDQGIEEISQPPFYTKADIISQGNICVFEYYAILANGENKTSVIEKFEFQDDGLVKKSSVGFMEQKNLSDNSISRKSAYRVPTSNSFRRCMNADSIRYFLFPLAQTC